ncbi:MAG: DHH family phosphoesterase [Candidatus Micrarchaeia archaeon]|jgi:nanoRNase/pAp phosphatase (c-di-AMP/oligoRNAs hydrolase)
MQKKFANAARFLSTLKGKTLITFQEVADPDAIASAVALSLLVRNCDVRATGQVNSQAKAVLRSLGLAIVPLESLEGYANILITDACTLDSFGKWADAIGNFKGTVAFFDHHIHSDRMKADFSLELPSISSTSEIAFGILGAAGKKVDKKTAMLLAAGVASDSGHWKSANDDSFEAMAHLLKLAGKSKQDYQKILALIERPANPEMSKKKMAAAAKAKVIEKDGIMVAATTSDSFHLQCAVGLVDLGADYAFVADAKQGIILAARSDSSKKSIGKLMQLVAKKISGSGGGHEKVGGARGKFSDAGAILDYCAKIVLD